MGRLRGPPSRMSAICASTTIKRKKLLAACQSTRLRADWATGMPQPPLSKVHSNRVLICANLPVPPLAPQHKCCPRRVSVIFTRIASSFRTKTCVILIFFAHAIFWSIIAACSLLKFHHLHLGFNFRFDYATQHDS